MEPIKDEELLKLNDELNKITIPEEKLNSSFTNAISKFHKEKRQIRIRFQIIAVVAMLFMMFTVGVRMSPVFAKTMSQIPGLGPLVYMIVDDKSMEDIITNHYVEKMHVEERKNQLTFTLLSAIADESGMVLSYQLEGAHNISNLYDNKIEIRQHGKPIPASIGVTYHKSKETNIVQNNIEVVFTDKAIIRGNTFELWISFTDPSKTQFTIPFTLSQPIQQTKIYSLNKTVDVSGQQMRIEQLKISPLRAEIKCSIPKENSEQLLQLNKVALIDETGEEWGKIQNGISGVGDIRDGAFSILIQSNYFRMPKSLTLVIDQIEALPKGEDYIIVDLAKKNLVYVPKQLDLNFEVISFNHIRVVYPIAKPHMMRSLLGTVEDSNNRVSSAMQASFSSSDDGTKVEGDYGYETKNVVNPVTIYIESYPRFLEGKVQLDIPLDE